MFIFNSIIFKFNFSFDNIQKCTLKIVQKLVKLLLSDSTNATWHYWLHTCETRWDHTQAGWWYIIACYASQNTNIKIQLFAIVLCTVCQFSMVSHNYIFRMYCLTVDCFNCSSGVQYARFAIKVLCEPSAIFFIVVYF